MASRKKFLPLAFGTLGIVYGDIGTSPLYAFRLCFAEPYNLKPTPEHIMGILSLITWALILVVSIKYLALVLRMDNKGEGGILTLASLVVAEGAGKRYNLGPVILGVGLFGAALLFGDGVITPALSVMSAIEGIEVVTKGVSHLVIPITIGILTGFFIIQSRGTGKISVLFVPITLIWFIVIGILGAKAIFENPTVLGALSPTYAVQFFMEQKLTGWFILGAIFLVVTGTEALYADLGHFGRKPIQFSWFTIVFPAILLNYFGQGAHLIMAKGPVGNPFFQLAPDWAVYPLIVLATAATIIASQAILSGVFSLTSQCVQLGYLPPLEIRHTSFRTKGRVYVPVVNWLIWFGTVLLILGFRSSDGLAAAYGIAVSADMVLTSLLLFWALKVVFKWPLWIAVSLTFILLAWDLSFFSALLTKIPFGGWVPLVFAVGIFTIMKTWRRGVQILRESMLKETISLTKFFEKIKKNPPQRNPGTVVYMNFDPHMTPPALIYSLEDDRTIHEQILFLTISLSRRAHIDVEKRIKVVPLGSGFYQIIASFGFMDTPEIPWILEQVKEGYGDLKFDPQEATVIVTREYLTPSKDTPMAAWRCHLFRFLYRNVQRSTVYFHRLGQRILEINPYVKF